MGRTSVRNRMALPEGEQEIDLTEQTSVRHVRASRRLGLV